MAFVKTVPPESATGLVKQHYGIMEKMFGLKGRCYFFEAFSLLPEVAQSFIGFLNEAKKPTGLDQVLYELMECRIMYLLRTRYSLLNHCWILAHFSRWDHDRIKRLIHSPQDSDLGAREKAVLAFAEKAVLHSNQITQADADALKKVGFSDEQYLALTFSISALVCNGMFVNLQGVEIDEFAKPYADIADW